MDVNKLISEWIVKDTYRPKHRLSDIFNVKNFSFDKKTHNDTELSTSEIYKYKLLANGLLEYYFVSLYYIERLFIVEIESLDSFLGVVIHN